MNYCFSVILDKPVDDAIELLKQALAEQQLGIVSDVDVAGVVKNKLDQDMPAYRILGACNPQMAKTMIDAVPQAGALLPCTIVVRALADGAAIDFMNPLNVMSLADSAVMNEVASDALAKLHSVADKLTA